MNEVRGRPNEADNASVGVRRRLDVGARRVEWDVDRRTGDDREEGAESGR